MRTARSTRKEQLFTAGGIAAYCGFCLAWGDRPGAPLTLAYPSLVLGLLSGLVVHELAHAVVADRLGDATPRLAGRLTLNPLAHLHPLGTLLILCFGLGWARPVAIDFDQLRQRKRGLILATAAGPLANLALGLVLIGAAVAHAVIIKGEPYGDPCGEPGVPELFEILLLLSLANLFLFAFNLIPIPPLDGSRIAHELLPKRWRAQSETPGMFAASSLALLVLASFLSPRAELAISILTVLSPFAIALLVIARSLALFGA